jgi:ribonucleoside-diphosphate reductase alpha chain
LVLKNNRGTDENRIRHMDYGVQINKLFYDRLVNGENITLFSPDIADGDLYDFFFSDQDAFKELYESLEKDPNITKKSIPAIELFTSLATERAQTGRIYIHNVDNSTEQGMFDPVVAPVKQSNLCVAPETLVLTDVGFLPIADLEGQKVNVWNGEEFSETTVYKTGINRPLIKVCTDSGQELECTMEHHFYTQNSYRGKPERVAAKDLKVGDKLIKFELPIIEGDKMLKHPYDNGFYSADGCYISSGNHQRIYLYGDKKSLLDKFTAEYYSIIYQDKYNRIYLHTKDLKDKFFVPDASYTIDSRLKWLAGYLDGDGCIYRNGTNEQITAASINLGFLKDIQLMLMTMGVNSKITETKNSKGMHLLPANDGSNSLKEYNCKQQWRLLIPSVESQKLLNLGLKLHRLTINFRTPQRSAIRFIKVTNIINNGRVDDTFCFTEPKRNMGFFNGLLTGQCMEILLPTQPMGSPNEEIALCTLAGLNLGTIDLDKPEAVKATARVAVRALDNLLDYQEYPVKAAEINKMRRTLGIGVINYAYALAKRDLEYGSPEGLEFTHRLFELIQFSLLEASADLAIEKGKCELFEQTRYARGETTISRSNTNIKEFCNTPLYCDWSSLIDKIVSTGLRNSTLTALMPAETSAQINNATNGIEPPRQLLSVKSSKDGVYKQAAPELFDLYYNYTTTWSPKFTNKGYLRSVAIMQKFVDQSISANTYYNPSNYPDNKVPLTDILSTLIYAHRIGIKTLYYHNTNDNGNADVPDGVDCIGGCKL